MTVPSLLIIDDSEEVLELVRATLRDELLVIYHAADSDEGLTLAQALRPDLILLDVDLPQVSGFETCQLLKSDPATEEIPVAFLSGADQTDSKVLGLELGAIDYITKPFAPAEFKARVRALLRTRKALARLAEQATYDSLTSLMNRAGFDQQLQHEVNISRAHGKPLSLLLLDIDKFKQLNDSYGHLFGDEALRQFGRFLLQGKRETDTAFRYGGEEFVVLMRNTNLREGLIHAEHLRRAAAELPFNFQGQAASLTFSGGLSCTTQQPSGQADGQSLVAMADAALYTAKQRGRNRIVFAESGSCADPINH